MPSHQDYAAMAISWKQTKDPHFPYEAIVNGQRLILRLNDWPDSSSLYTLMIGATTVVEVEEWPANWKRPRKTR